MGGYYHVLLSWGTGGTKAEASTALNLGLQIDIILSLWSWASSGNVLGPILV